jgi:hypothetical protein
VLTYSSSSGAPPENCSASTSKTSQQLVGITPAAKTSESEIVIEFQQSGQAAQGLYASWASPNGVSCCIRDGCRFGEYRSSRDNSISPNGTVVGSSTSRAMNIKT